MIRINYLSECVTHLHDFVHVMHSGSGWQAHMDLTKHFGVVCVQEHTPQLIMQVADKICHFTMQLFRKVLLDYN